MATATKPRRTKPVPSGPPIHYPLWQWPVERYEELIRKVDFPPDRKVELLDGWVVDRPPRTSKHLGTMSSIRNRIEQELPDDWDVDSPRPIRLAKSLPEPDVAIIAAAADNYRKRNPIAEETATIIDVSLRSTFRSRVERARIYAEAGIPVYWIVYVSKGIIEVFTDPANGKKWRYRTVKQYGKGDTIPLVLRGKKIADIPVRELV